MKKAKHLLLASVLTVTPAFAFADLSYNYLSAGYVFDGEFDAAGVDLDGFAFGGSFAVINNVYLFGNYQMLETDPGDVDFDRFDLGAGFHTPVADNIDLDISLAYTDIEIGSFDDDGYQLKAGVRGLPSNVFEWSAYLVHEDINESDTGFELGARYFFVDDMSAGLALRDVSDVETLAINFRVDF